MNDRIATMRRILGDHWEGVLNHEWTVEEASSADLDRALERLDARIYTMITVQLGGEQHLTIGGGAGQYVVYATFDNEVFWNLLRPQPIVGTVLLNVGGQQGDFLAAQVVDKQQARVAGHVFLNACLLNPTQQWEKG
jgi:Immunity protein Imm1